MPRSGLVDSSDSKSDVQEWAVIEGRVVVSPRGEARIRRGHPWVFRSDVSEVQGTSPGAVVEVRGKRGSLGFGFYSDRSEIRVRMLKLGTFHEDFLARRLSAALEWRRVVAPDAPAHRLVHSEGDGLPGLVVDRYGPYLVLQTLAQGTDRLKEEITRHLVDLVQPKGILERNDPKVRRLEGLEPKVSLLYGDVPRKIEVREGDLTLEVDLWEGQKTGLFLDQRENHLALRGYARGKVLDAFTYSGGFALHAARVASEVVAVDVSQEAAKKVESNAARNGLKNVRAVEANAFDFLRECEASREFFDTIILDPPAFAKNKSQVASARRGYKEINLRALRLLTPGGILFTCSCSYHVSETGFEEILEEAASDAGVRAALVEKRRQARDHPIALAVPETAYLKCFVIRKLEDKAFPAGGRT